MSSRKIIIGYDRSSDARIAARWALDEAVVEHPAAALTSAGPDAQLLVVGSRGRGALRGMLLGSVSQHLLRHAACDVAIVHEAKA